MPEQDKPVAALTEDQRARLEEFIEEEEGSLNRYLLARSRATPPA